VFTLSEDIGDRIEGTRKDFSLHPIPPKAESAKARKIEIKP
jgi:hypothetical protein